MLMPSSWLANTCDLLQGFQSFSGKYSRALRAFPTTISPYWNNWLTTWTSVCSFNCSPVLICSHNSQIEYLKTDPGIPYAAGFITSSLNKWSWVFARYWCRRQQPYSVGRRQSTYCFVIYGQDTTIIFQ